jgi:hypothetical protein
MKTGTIAKALLAAAILSAPLPLLRAGPDKVTYEGGDGTSYEKAVVIKGATEETGVHAEYVWLAKHYPGCHEGRQSLTTHGNHPFDLLEITTTDGKNLTVYFDITDYFGKM